MILQLHYLPPYGANMIYKWQTKRVLRESLIYSPELDEETHLHRYLAYSRMRLDVPLVTNANEKDAWEHSVGKSS